MRCSRSAFSLWTPYVDAFLKRRQLVLRDSLLPVPLPNIATPPASARTAARRSPTTWPPGPHKAFAMSPNGAFGWRAGRRTVEEAAQGRAARICAQARQPGLPHRGRRRGRREPLASPIAPAQPLALACLVFMAVVT